MVANGSIQVNFVRLFFSSKKKEVNKSYIYICIYICMYLYIELLIRKTDFVCIKETVFSFFFFSFFFTLSRSA